MTMCNDSCVWIFVGVDADNKERLGLEGERSEQWSASGDVGKVNYIITMTKGEIRALRKY